MLLTAPRPSPISIFSWRLERSALSSNALLSSSLPLRDANLLHDLAARAGLILEQLNGLLQLALVALDGLDALRVGLVGMVQANLELVDLALKSLLDTKGLTLGLLLSLPH